MATFEKRGSRYRARVRKDGIDLSESFLRLGDAKAWAAQVESDLYSGKLGKCADRTFADAIDRYITDILPKHKGERAETLRLNRIKASFLGAVRLEYLTADKIAQWRDKRLLEVSAASVRREWNTLSALCTVAVKEWRWMQGNPFSQVKRPDAPIPRSRRVTAQDIERLEISLSASPATKTGRTFLAFLFAVETAMRQGEICALNWCDVDTKKRVACVLGLELGAGKSGSRTVPLSVEAIRILEILPKISDRCFSLDASTCEALFRKGRDKAAIVDLHFHDSRREALTRLADKVDVLTLAKISGHRDLRILQAVYYAPCMSEVAAKLG